jgi:hypothetical protein
MVEELVRAGMPGVRCLTGPHREGEDLDESKDVQLAKHDGEGVHEDHFDVKNHEDHRDQVETDGESLWRLVFGDDPTFVGRALRVRGSLVRRQPSRCHK